MIAPGAGVRVYLACGVTDMRKGITADRRARADLPPGGWSAVRHRTGHPPASAAGGCRMAAREQAHPAEGGAVAALVYAAIFLLHEPVIGVTPRPV